MGWLCSKCGTENGIAQKKCRACRKKAGVYERVSGLFITLWECRAEEAVCSIGTKLRRYGGGTKLVGGANRAVGISIWIAAALGVLTIVLLCSDPLCLNRAQQHLQAVSRRLTQLGDTALERMDSLIRDELDPTGKYTLLMADYYLDRFRGACARFGGTIAELWRNGTAHLQRHGQLLGRELSRLDIHFAAWLINRLYELKGWLREIGFDGADGLIVKLCDDLAQGIEWLRSLRS